MFRFLSFAGLFCCFTNTVYAVAPMPMSVRIGIENTYKNGLWTPITIESASPIETLAIRCSDSDGTPITYRYEIDGSEEPATVSPDDAKKTTVLAKMGRKDEPIQISVNGGNYESFPVPPPVNAERPIYLIFGNDDIGLQGAVAELMLREDRRPLLVKVNSFADLPTEWFGYEAVEMVALTTTEPELFDGLTANSPQIQALNDWLKLGGKMLLCAGKNSEQFLDNEDGLLRLFLPGTFTEMTEMRSGTAFELFVNSKRQIFMNGTDEAPFMKMPRFTEPRGIVFMKDGDLPLVLRCAHGLGTIIYFGGDLSGRPLNNWRDRTALVRNIMQWSSGMRSAGGAANVRSGAMLQLGYNDIAGQIRSALDQFEGVRVVPFSVILLILTAYWLVIGLFDWFFVHKVLKKPILTWITFPLWIVLFSFLTYVLAAPGRPDDTAINYLLVYDYNEESRVGRTFVWRTMYAPVDRHFSSGSKLHSSNNGYYSWNGLPGSGLGGMAPKTVSPSVWQIDSEQVSYNEIANVPVQTRSTKSFFSRSAFFFGEPESEYRVIFSKLSDEEGVPVGTIKVPDETLPLKNCILVYGRWALELGEIEPGQTIRITKTTPRREMRDLLIPPKALEDAALRGIATYNPQSTDLEYIVRVMTLHRALGGYESTGLHHAYMPSLDMSDLLSADRALLLGTVVDDYKSSVSIGATTVFRASLPITLTELSPRLGRERYEPSGGVLDEKARPGYVDPDSGR